MRKGIEMWRRPIGTSLTAVGEFGLRSCAACFTASVACVITATSTAAAGERPDVVVEG